MKDARSRPFGFVRRLTFWLGLVTLRAVAIRHYPTLAAPMFTTSAPFASPSR
jgi:hypothetical protein